MRNDAAKIRNFSEAFSQISLSGVGCGADAQKLCGECQTEGQLYQRPQNFVYAEYGVRFQIDESDTRPPMLGSSDRTVSQATNDQVFYKSNIGPQLQNGFNTGGGVWNNCGDWVDTQWKGQADTTYQVIGCYWENESKKVNGTVVLTIIRCCCVPKTMSTNGWWSVRATNCSVWQYVSARRTEGTKPSQYVAKGFVMSVADLEKKTGQTYFANVPNAPKDTYNASDWGCRHVCVGRPQAVQLLFGVFPPHVRRAGAENLGRCRVHMSQPRWEDRRGRMYVL